MAVTLNTKHLGSFVKEHELDAVAHQVQAAHDLLHSKTGLGSDFLFLPLANCSSKTYNRSNPDKTIDWRDHRWR